MVEGGKKGSVAVVARKELNCDLSRASSLYSVGIFLFSFATNRRTIKENNGPDDL